MPASTVTVLEYTITGKPQGPTLVFIHGWPDDASLWRRQVAALQDEYRCVCLTLPNFGAERVKSGGFDFPSLTGMLAATLDEVQPGGAPVTLVTHDWGAYLGYLLDQSRPGRVDRMIALDIGGHVAPSGREALMIVGYQWALVLFWLIGGVSAAPGNRLTRWLAGRLRAPARQAGKARSRMNYLYAQIWRGMLLPWRRRHLLRRYRPNCPVLFLWGESKPVMFHSRYWLETVERTGGHHAGIAGAGHWFMESHPDVVNRAIRDWMSEEIRSLPEKGRRPA